MPTRTLYVDGEFRPDSGVFDFCHSAFDRLHPGNDAEAPKDIFGSHVKRLRIAKILGEGIPLEEVLDMTCFSNPEDGNPRRFFILHGFLGTGKQELSGSSMLGVPKGKNTSNGTFKGPVCTTDFRDPHRVVQRTLGFLKEFLGDGDTRIPFVHSGMVLTSHFSEKEE